MISRLRSYDATPPGGYPYEQTEGIYRKFPSQPLVEAQAAIVADFRKGNGLPRATVKEALIDIDQYTCQRLGGMSSWCVPVDAQNVPVVALNSSSPVITPCAGCGAKV